MADKNKMLLLAARGLSVEPPQGSTVEVVPAGTGAESEGFPQGSEDVRLEDRDFIPHGSEDEAEEEMGGRFQGSGEA